MLVKVYTGRSMTLSGAAVEDVRRALPWRGGGWSSPVTVPYQMWHSLTCVEARTHSGPEHWRCRL